jgi:glycosyltransferase involved in cell wall biosynthesis
MVLNEMGHETLLIETGMFSRIRIDWHLEIDFAYAGFRGVGKMLREFQPDAIHAMTQGPLGWATRRFCSKRRIPFTSSLRTRFPEYLTLHTRLPLTRIGYRFFCLFHNRSARTTVANQSMRELLLPYGFRNVVLWPCGVDTQRFYPCAKHALPGPRPIFLYMGRVVKEKNIEAFLDLKLPGSKYVVGDGPHLAKLQRNYPDAFFTGHKGGDELAEHLSAADVFVFPSLTDTFGQVMLQANACGVPVAAFPAIGPKDFITNAVNGFVDDDLAEAAQRCLSLDPEACVRYAQSYSWQACTETFLSLLVRVPSNAWSA